MAERWWPTSSGMSAPLRASIRAPSLPAEMAQTASRPVVAVGGQPGPPACCPEVYSAGWWLLRRNELWAAPPWNHPGSDRIISMSRSRVGAT